MMRTYFILFAFFLFSCCPSLCQESDSLRFGTPYEDAVRQLTTLYGVPSVMDENHCVFKNSLFEHGGITFNEVKCNFKNRRLVEERFYKTAPTKRIAVRDMMQMKQALESQYSLSEDYEDDGTAFFCGGLAPTGIGRLFTLSVCRIEDAGPCYCNTVLSITKTEIHRSAFPFRLNGHEYPQTLQGVDRQFMAIYFVTFFIMLGADVFGEYLASVLLAHQSPRLR